MGFGKKSKDEATKPGGYKGSHRGGSDFETTQKQAANIAKHNKRLPDGAVELGEPGSQGKGKAKGSSRLRKA